MQLKMILKVLMKEEDISVAKLAKETRVPVQTLHNWLSGTEPRSLKQVRIVANYIEVTIDYLCFGIGEAPKAGFNEYMDEINAGIFEVVLRRPKK